MKKDFTLDHLIPMIKELFQKTITSTINERLVEVILIHEIVLDPRIENIFSDFPIEYFSGHDVGFYFNDNDNYTMYEPINKIVKQYAFHISTVKCDEEEFLSKDCLCILVAGDKIYFEKHKPLKCKYKKYTEGIHISQNSIF